MAITDAKLNFCTDQAITSTTAANSTNVIDFGAKINPGLAQGFLQLAVEITEDFTTSSSAAMTLTVKVEASSDSFASDTRTLAEYVFPEADLVVGKVLPIQALPVAICQQMKLNFQPSVVCTKGKVTAGLVTGMGNWYAYPSAPSAV